MSEKFRDAIKAAADMTKEERDALFCQWLEKYPEFKQATIRDSAAVKASIREFLTEQSIIAYREDIIEECAQVAQNWFHRPCFATDIATAIRTLKEKP